LGGGRNVWRQCVRAQPDQIKKSSIVSPSYSKIYTYRRTRFYASPCSDTIVIEIDTVATGCSVLARTMRASSNTRTSGVSRYNRWLSRRWGDVSGWLTTLYAVLLLCSVAATNASSHLACSDGNPQPQQLQCVSWATAPSSYIITGLSSSSSSSSMSATAADNLRRYDAARASQYAARPTSLPVSAVIMPAAAPTGAADAVRSKSILGADKAAFRPPSISLTHKPPVFAHPTISNSAAMFRGSTGYSGAPVAVRNTPAVDGPTSPCHVDPALGGACVACEYIRVNTWQRYEPYSTRRYDKSSSNKPYRVCYYWLEVCRNDYCRSFPFRVQYFIPISPTSSFSFPPIPIPIASNNYI